MKTRLPLALLLAALAPALAFAQSGFNGTWKIDLNKAQLPDKLDELLLQDGMYHCKSCAPPVSVKADGRDQKVAGDPYYDTLSVKIIDDRTIEGVQKKAGRVIGSSRESVSADGNTLTLDFTNTNSPNGEPIRGRYIETRVAPGPPGSHAISGTWRPAKVESSSESALVFSIRMQSDTLRYSAAMGQSYVAKIDGPEVPYRGDPGITSVRLRRIDQNTLEETDKFQGRIVSVQRMTLAPDGRTMDIFVDDKTQGTASRFVAVKQ